MNHWTSAEMLSTTEDGRFRRIIIEKTRLLGVAQSFAPGDCVDEHLHRNTDEVFYVVSGTGRMTVNGKDVELRPGDVLFAGAGDRHAVSVDEAAAEPFVIFAVVAPPPNSEDETVFTGVPTAG